MRRYGRTIGTVMIASLIAILLLNTDPAADGIRNGINICLQTVIPGLFPFVFLGGLLNSCLIGSKAAILRPLGKLCGIPEGMESVFMLGLIGGYPVGAQMTAECYRNGMIDKKSAERMLGFCNCAGPSFIIGILSPQFDLWYVPYALWLIHIVGAIITGAILPGKTERAVSSLTHRQISVSQCMERSLRTIAVVCGWIVIFRCFFSVALPRIEHLLSPAVYVALMGLGELANGCVSLRLVEYQWLRFVFSSVLLGFGGLCVFLQTASVSKGLRLRNYVFTKILHGLVSLILALPVAYFIG